MRNLTNMLHILQSLLGIIFGLFVAYAAYENAIDGSPEIAPGRFILSAILLVYSCFQFVRIFKWETSLVNLLFFLPIYSVFGLFWEYFSRGYIKGWAPSTVAEAKSQNLVGLFLLVLCIALAVWTTLKRPRSGGGG